MKSPIRVRKFFAYVVLACWIGVTLLTVGDSIADEYAEAAYVHEKVFHAKPESDNIGQLTSENEALRALVDFQKDRALEAKGGFRIWIVLTLIGAALFAERERSLSLPNRAG